MHPRSQTDSELTIGWWEMKEPKSHTFVIVTTERDPEIWRFRKGTWAGTGCDWTSTVNQFQVQGEGI